MGEKSKPNEEATSTNPNGNACQVVDIDPFLLEYAREKYGCKPKSNKPVIKGDPFPPRGVILKD